MQRRGLIQLLACAPLAGLPTFAPAKGRIEVLCEEAVIAEQEVDYQLNSAMTVLFGPGLNTRITTMRLYNAEGSLVRSKPLKEVIGSDVNLSSRDRLRITWTLHSYEA